MSMTIAMAGKGGTGKTTIAGLLIRFLLKKGIKPILAVDADANANLNEVLGLEVETTLGEAREGLKDGVPPGMTRDLYMEYKVHESLIESEGYDLIVMGRPEGPGCYCHANTLLSRYMDTLCENYRVVVMDNEAGMEHISRLVARHADILLIVSDPTQRGILAAKRIRDLARELKVNIKKEYAIINRVNGELPAAVRAAAEAAGLNIAGCVPEDELISRYDTEGQPTAQLPDDAMAVQALNGIFETILEK
ncbi:MAG TPA: carbon monoxide dehydrogenase [Desulfobacterales bacterium]|jgi:CO dehydrogenase maturation factor|nr:carbon monoxide dehydrogenase [Desulfobacterales bacterium]